MILRGRIIADCTVEPQAPDSGHPVGTCTPTTTGVTPGVITQIWGNDDIDQFQFGDASGIPTYDDEKTDFADPGYIFLGSKTVVRGSASPVTSGDAAHNPSIDDGEDLFTVFYLQSASVLAAPAQSDVPALYNGGHSLTLDGQADTDYYRIYTTGSRFSERNYVINVLDTGAENDGVDELDIYGRDNHDPTYNGYEPGTVTRNPNDDLFLLRAVKCIDTDGVYGLDAAAPTNCDGVAGIDYEAADQPAIVALLHGDANGYKSRVVGDEVSDSVQRIHYDAALNGRVAVYGYDGNDEFYVDDTTAIVTLDGGEGYDKFQIGQIFGTKRDQYGIENPATPVEDPPANPIDDGGTLLPHDTFPVLIATTRGWLSPGTHAPLVATGGTGNDEFVVYSNQAELRLEGHDDNDLFIVRAFAIAAVCDTDADGDGVAASPTSTSPPTPTRCSSRST